MKLVDNWKQWYKMWTIRINIFIGFVIMVLAQFPEVFMHLWVLLPDSVQSQMSEVEGSMTIIIILLVVSTLARLIQQNKIHKGREEL